MEENQTQIHLPEEEEKDFPPKRRQTWPKRLIALLVACVLLFFSFAYLMRLSDLPPIDLLITSRQLTKDETIRSWTKAVVGITADSRSGTGFILAPDNIIVTNRHILEESRQLTVRMSRNEYVVSEWFDCQDEDLALIPLPEETNSEDLTSLPLETELSPEPGDKLTLIGNPQGLFRVACPVTFAGFVSDEKKQRVAVYGAIYKGNSGSPVINDRGHVIGIVFASATTSDQKKDEVMGLLIPAEVIRQAVEMRKDK